ncbi:MAG: hypothetical protein Q8L48_06290 [Archangium sp.]|nr:hypothetical protein [Archangium sp.]
MTTEEISSASPSPRGGEGRGEGILLVAVGLLCLGFQLWLPTTHVAEADYQSVANTLTAERQPGDVVLLAPWWTERARIYVPEGLPVVGYQGSDADPLERYARIWVLAEPRLPNAGLGDFEKAFSPSRSPLGAERRFGNLSLRLYQNGRHRPVTVDAADVLGQGQAQVYLESPDGNRQPCTWTGAAWRCPNGKIAGKEWHEVHFAPYSCVKFEAPGGATRVVAEFVAPASESSTLSAGYIWEYGAYKDSSITPATVTLEVNGQAQTLELPVGDELMHRLEGPALPEGARVRIALSSGNPTARVVCVVMTGSRRAP